MTDIDRRFLEIIGHLGAALIQQAPSDDKIIMGHVRDAHALLSVLRIDVLDGLASERADHEATIRDCEQHHMDIRP